MTAAGRNDHSTAPSLTWRAAAAVAALGQVQGQVRVSLVRGF